jgi:hypothetical protein
MDWTLIQIGLPRLGKYINELVNTVPTLEIVSDTTNFGKSNIEDVSME